MKRIITIIVLKSVYLRRLEGESFFRRLWVFNYCRGEKKVLKGVEVIKNFVNYRFGVLEGEIKCIYDIWER